MAFSDRIRPVLGIFLMGALLCNCGGGGGQSVQSVPAIPTAGGKQPASMKVNISIPLTKKTSTSRGRKPQFVSPATQSAQITVGAQLPVTVNLTATSPGCAFPVTESLNEYEPNQLALASDGTMWFANEGGSVGQIAPGGALVGSPILATNTVTMVQDAVISIGADQDGTMWVGHYYGNPTFSIAHAGTSLGPPQYQNVSINPLPGYVSSEALGSDGYLYFSYLDESLPNVPASSTIGRVVYGSYDSQNFWTAGSGVGRLMPGTDGSIWFTEQNGNIGHLTFPGLTPTLNEIPTGSTGVLNGGVPDYNQIGLAVNPSDGSVYFPKFSSPSPLTISTIGHLDINGNPLSDIAVPASVGAVYGLTVGTDGAIWIANGQGIVGRVTTAGQYTSYPTPLGNAASSGNSTVLDVKTGSDGNVYFAERTGGYVGYVQPTLQCSASVPVPVGATTVSIRTYDGSNGTGNLLSQTLNQPVTISPNSTNSINFTLYGVVDHVALVATPPTYGGCVPPFNSTSTITASALDAQGNIIIGPGNVTDASGNSLQLNLSVTDALQNPPGDSVSPSTLTFPGIPTSTLTIHTNASAAPYVQVNATSVGAPAAVIPNGINGGNPLTIAFFSTGC